MGCGWGLGQRLAACYGAGTVHAVDHCYGSRVGGCLAGLPRCLGRAGLVDREHGLHRAPRKLVSCTYALRHTPCVSGLTRCHHHHPVLQQEWHQAQGGAQAGARGAVPHRGATQVGREISDYSCS